MQIGCHREKLPRDVSEFSPLCYFLYLAGFKYLLMRNAVRCNDSSRLDLIWRENLPSARTSLANKTNYAPMLVVRVLARLLGPGARRAAADGLPQAAHAAPDPYPRRVRDRPIENLNLLIREGVTTGITKDLITKFIRRLNFTSVVNRSLDAIFRWRRKEDQATDKNIDNDVGLIKEFLREKIGTNYTAATTATDLNDLELDLSSWGGSRHARQQAPRARA